MPFLRVRLRPVLDPSKTSAGLLYYPALPFGLDAELLQVFLEAPHPITPLSKMITLHLDHLPNNTLFGRHSFSMRATEPANNILRLRAVASVLLEYVLTSAWA